MQAELRMQKISNVNVFNLSPGMVTTELLMAGARGRLGRVQSQCRHVHALLKHKAAPVSSTGEACGAICTDCSNLKLLSGNISCCRYPRSRPARCCSAWHWTQLGQWAALNSWLTAHLAHALCCEQCTQQGLMLPCHFAMQVRTQRRASSSSTA